MQYVDGIGGVFLFSTDPERLARWYADHLGIQTTFNQEHDNYYCMFTSRAMDDSQQQVHTVWAVLRAKEAFPAGCRQAQVNYRVTNLDAVMAHLKSKQIAIEKVEEYEYGRFAWITDCDGNRIELYQPAPAPTETS